MKLNEVKIEFLLFIFYIFTYSWKYSIINIMWFTILCTLRAGYYVYQ